jgi:spore maturation protein CgeB
LTRRLLLVGQDGNTHIGASFLRAGREMDLEVAFLDVRAAWSTSRIRTAFDWRFRGHRPSRLSEFSRHVVRQCEEFTPDYLLTTGAGPVDQSALRRIGALGIRRINFSTDDPWNPGQYAPWFMRSLCEYDAVFSARRSNLDDFRRHGVRNVKYLPFGFDPYLWMPDQQDDRSDAPLCDVLFVGGADRDRAPFVTALSRAGLRVAVFGGYWSRYVSSTVLDMGLGDAGAIRRATRAAPVSLCLIRRANRDGHVMRSFEIPAIGGCMLAEDTTEHREIFGKDGDRVIYFDTEVPMVDRARELLANVALRQQLAERAHTHILSTRNTYRDRLQTMLSE